jgi:hypothetical protein
MEALLKEIKSMSFKERYHFKMSLMVLFEEKEFVYLDTDEFGQISSLQRQNKEPYQIYVCNQHKTVELVYNRCYKCVNNILRTKEEEDEAEKFMEKALEELLS